MLRLAAPFLALTLVAVSVAGCGGSAKEGATDAPIGASAESCDSYASDVEALRATDVPCDQARQVMDGWRREQSCAVPSDASRASCLTRSYRCQAVRTDRGLAVSCARPGRSLAFIAKP